jgi:hypothetical protein
MTVDETFENHDPSLEPYASMSRYKILELMHHPETSSQRLAFLEQFLLEKMTIREPDEHNHAGSIASFLIKEYDAYGNDQCRLLYCSARTLANVIGEGMPARGPPEECNGSSPLETIVQTLRPGPSSAKFFTR